MTTTPVTSQIPAYLELVEMLEAWRPHDTPDEAPLWQQPAQLGHGILTSTIAFRLARLNRQAPPVIARQLQTQLRGYVDERKLPVEVELAGPYLNIKLAEAAYGSILGLDLTKNVVATDNRRVMLEYIGANVAKRLHAGHMRNLNIGDALRRLLSLKYPNMLTDNHWGDWGVQFGVLLWAYKRSVDKDAYADNPLDELQRLYVWGNAQEESFDGWAEAVRQEFVLLESGDAQNRKLWEEFVAVSKLELKHELALFGVPPTDLEQGESFYERDMAKLRSYMDQAGIWQREGEARYLDFESVASHWQGIDPALKSRIASFGRCYYVSTNGYTTYAFRDVAARLQWARDHKIDLAVTLTDKTQSHNFDQAFATICYLASRDDFSHEFGTATAERLSWNNLVHIGYGFLQLASGKMSTRRGNVLRLPQLVREVEEAARAEITRRDTDLPPDELASRARAIAIASLKWADLNRDPLTDVVLDPSLITSFEGNTGTYQLYTYARLRSVLQKAGYSPGALTATSFEADERTLIDRLYIMPATLEQAIEGYRPNLVATYVYELAEAANRWYVQAPRVVEMDADDPRRHTMLMLIDKVSEQLCYGLDLLGIQTTERL